MKRSPFIRPKQILVFNGAGILIAIVRSIRTAADLFKANAQAISFVCTGKYNSTGGFYYRHIHPDVLVETDDIDALHIKDYDEMCKELNRKYYTVQEMARRRNVKKNKANK